jgi:HEPN domain-containing protein
LSKSIGQILFRKALHDYNSAVHLASVDPEVVGDQVVGYLLQQSVEKSCKALILYSGSKYNRTHDLGELFKTISKKYEVPPEFIPLEGLTGFSAAERYESPPSRERLDRGRLIDVVRHFLEWVGGLAPGLNC